MQNPAAEAAQHTHAYCSVTAIAQQSVSLSLWAQRPPLGTVMLCVVAGDCACAFGKANKVEREPLLCPCHCLCASLSRWEEGRPRDSEQCPSSLLPQCRCCPVPLSWQGVWEQGTCLGCKEHS